MVFRNALEADLEEMKFLFLETVKNVCRNDYNQEEIEAWISSSNDSERWVEVLKNQFVLLAIIEDKIVGFGTLEQGNYIDLFYIHKDFQRKGIATVILSKLEDEARKLNSKNMISDVSITAKAFFEKSGFVPEKMQRNIRNNVVLVNYKMEKQL